jgi:peptidoglycan hydrolase-like amidase
MSPERIDIEAESIKYKQETFFDYQIYSGDESKGILKAGELAVLNYSNGTYFFTAGDSSFNSPKFLRLVPVDFNNYFTLVNYQRKVVGKTKNFNVYRGVLEFRYSAKSNVPYIINELPLDEYVAGVAETSDSSPVEYNKALIVAERSYAYYHVMRSVASPGTNLFDVFPTTADQLYLGYNSEILMPHVVAQTLSTRGEMVTYDGKPVVTPYYSRSDGRTRSWKEVWGGDYYPWLKSVEAVYDKGKTMLGHGVGMSGSDALKRAGNDGWTYDQLLKYYYTGVNVEKIF